MSEYVAPATLEATVAALAAPGARVLAGGTDLIVLMKERGVAPERIVDVKQVAELQQLTFSSGEGLHLGAAVPCSAIWSAPAVAANYPALVESARLIGSWQVQNRATLGGNLCNASPAADGIPALIIYGAQAIVAGPKGTRRVPVDQFCTAPGQTVLAPGELLVAFHLPPPPPHFAAAYRRFTPREEMDIAVVGVGAGVRVDPGSSRCTAATLALAAVAPKPLRATAAEACLQGQVVTEALIEEAAGLAAAAARPISDLRASADFRRHLVRVLARRVLQAAFAAARNGGEGVVTR